MLNPADRGASRAVVGDTTSPLRLFISRSRADGRAFAEAFERRIETDRLHGPPRRRE